MNISHKHNVDQKKRGRIQCMLLVFNHAHLCGKNNEKNKGGEYI